MRSDDLLRDGPEAPDRAAHTGVVWRWRLAVLAGGLLGSAFRVALDLGWALEPDAWPWPTFTVNLAGAFLLGVLMPRLVLLRNVVSLLLPLLAVGLLGALTTFSLFMYEAWLLVEHDRAVLAAGYVAATLAAGLVVALLGDRLAHRRGWGAAR